MDEKKQTITIDQANPYLGLSPFKEENSGFFFGRSTQVDRLMAFVKTHTLTILYGRSGYGKTSIIQAGLFPQLRRQGFLPLYIRIKFDGSAESLLNQIKVRIDDKIADIKVNDDLLIQDVSLWEYFHRLKLAEPYKQAVLVFDQFEEIFTLGKDYHDMLAEFMEALGCAIQNWKPHDVVDKYKDKEIPFDYKVQRFKIIFSLREDYLKDLESLTSYIPQIRNEKVRLRQMNGSDALEAVYAPAKLIISKENAEKLLTKIIKSITKENVLLKDLSQYEIEPFMLSLICQEVSDKRVKTEGKKVPQIDATLIDNVDVTNILQSFYVGHTTAVEREHIESLVSVDNVRIPSYKEDFIKKTALTAAATGRLIDERILRETEWNGKIYVELIHDVLIPFVKQNKEERESKQRRCYENYELGNKLLVENSIQKAYEHYQIAQQLGSELNEPLITGQTLEKLGVIEQKRNQAEKAIMFYNQALREFGAIQEHGAQGRLYERIAMYFDEKLNTSDSSKSDLKQIIDYYKESETHYRHAGDDMGCDRIRVSIENLRAKHQSWGYLINLKTGKAERLVGDTIQVGRSTGAISNDINLPNSFVSRRHVTISADLTIEDMHSTNGTTINGEDLSYGVGNRKLNEGDIVGIAGIEAFQFLKSADESTLPEIQKDTWAVFVASNSPQFLNEEIYSISLDQGQLALSPNLLEDQNAVLKIRNKKNVTLFTLDRQFESELFTNEYSLLFDWQFSKHLLLEVFSRDFFNKFIDWFEKNNGPTLTSTLIAHIESTAYDEEFVREFIATRHFAWNFHALPSTDKSEFIVSYNKTDENTWNTNYAAAIAYCKIQIKSDKLVVAEDQIDMYIPSNNWRVVYINKQDSGNPYYNFQLDTWFQSFYPAMYCTYFEPGINLIKEFGPAFQIIQLSKF